MTRFTGSALLALALLPAAASAQPQEGSASSARLEIAGEAPSACLVRGASAGSAVNASYQTSGASGG